MPSLIDSALNVLAVRLFTDRSVDFVLAQDQSVLTAEQKLYLSQTLISAAKKVINIRQVHGNKILAVTDANAASFDFLPEADGLVTNLLNCAIAVRTADCLPISLYDPIKKCIGIVHAGWRGTQQGIIRNAVQEMQAHWGSSTNDLLVNFGPAIRQCCYQVGDEFKNYFPEDITIREGANYLDLAQANKNQLLKDGVREENIFDSGSCTRCDARFFSYRREADKAGRHLSLIMLIDPASLPPGLGLKS